LVRKLERSHAANYRKVQAKIHNWKINYDFTNINQDKNQRYRYKTLARFGRMVVTGDPENPTNHHLQFGHRGALHHRLTPEALQ